MNFKLNTTESTVHESESYPEAASEAATYGALISEIDNKLRKLELNRNIYSSELKSVPRKRKSIISSITVNICILVVVAAILFYISTHSFMNMGVTLYYATWIFVFYMLIRIGKFIKIYLINMDNNFSRNYRIKHGVSTLVNEEEYCRGNYFLASFGYITTNIGIRQFCLPDAHIICRYMEYQFC